MKTTKKFEGSLKWLNWQFTKNSLKVNNHICIIHDTE